jgi:hypothetical protein
MEREREKTEQRTWRERNGGGWTTAEKERTQPVASTARERGDFGGIFSQFFPTLVSAFFVLFLFFYKKKKTIAT